MPEVSRQRHLSSPSASFSAAGDSFSVSEFNTLVHDVVACGFPRAVWVCGEVQEYERNKDKKHAFFSLVEKDPLTSEIKAKAGAVIWAFTRPKIEAVLKKAENAFELKDDIEVRFLCKVDFYAPHGALRLVVENIDPVHTLGKVAQERQKLIAELGKNGVLQKNKGAELSLLPLRIGLVTAPDSAAFHDFSDELKKSSYAFQVFFAPALMQGKGCPESVIGAMKKLQTVGELDAIVIIRGGGSIAELSCFDSRAIAEAVSGAHCPVITGIGHEINTTITDLAAHSFFKTPTAVAQFLAGRVMSFMDNVVQGYLGLVDAARGALSEKRERMRGAALELQSATAGRLQEERLRQLKSSESLRKMPRHYLARTGGRLGDETGLLKKTIRLRIEKSITKIGHCRTLVAMASPHNILKRGFSVTRLKDGTLVRDASDVVMKDTLVTELASGQVESVVRCVQKEDERG